MKKLFLLTSLFATVFTVIAQIANIPGAGNEVIRLKKYADVEGSPYLYTEWKSGTITDNTGKVYPNVLLKYDAYKDVLEINQEGTVMQLNTDRYPEFAITFADGSSNKVVKQKFSSGLTQIPGYSSKTYFEIVGDGSLTVLKKYDIKFIEDVVNNYGTAATVKRFQRGEKYFVVVNEVATEFKLNNKSFLSACGEKKAEMENILTQRKIKIKNEADLISVLHYYEN